MMKQSMLGAMIVAGMFAMQVQAVNVSIPGVPEPLPVQDLSAEVKKHTWDDGKTSWRIVLSWTAPAVSTPFEHPFLKITYNVALFDAPTAAGSESRPTGLSPQIERTYTDSRTESWDSGPHWQAPGRYRFGVMTHHYYTTPEPGIVGVTNNESPPTVMITVEIPEPGSEPETPTPPEPETPTPPEPETPTPPEPETPTPPEPETPTPPEPECRWEHRFSTFPAADGSGRGVLRITARKKGAQVRIAAFNRTDGTALTVRDLGNDRELSSPAVTLGAANTVARFAVAGDAGQHVLVVSHAEHVAGIRAVTATMMRQSGGTSQVVHPDVAEHCAPSASTAPEPETPAPPEPECRWEHRFGTFPTADSSGRGVLRITARKKGAQVRIAAFDRTHGTALTVRDLGNDRELSSPTVTLGAANTVARFAVDGDAGRHVLVVSHAEHVAGMRAVTAAMVRQSGGGASQVVHPDVAEHCEPSAAPDLVVRNAGALLWTDTFDWRASVVNIGDAAAAATTVRVYHGARELDTKAIERGVAAGSEWPMSDFITRNRPPVGDQVRICVDPIPGEAALSRTNNCASATVERNN